MAPGLQDSVWADGHQGRIKAASYRAIVPTEAIIIKNPNVQDAISADSEYHASTVEATRSQPIPSVVVTYHRQDIEKPLPAYTYSSENGAMQDPTIASEGTFPERLIDLGSGSRQARDPVEEFISGLDLSGRDLDSLRMLQIPSKKRIYSVAYLQRMRTNRILPRPFINVPPGRFAEMRKGIKIAYIAQEQGRTLIEGFKAFGQGELQVPDTPEFEREARRHMNQPASSPELDIQLVMERPAMEICHVVDKDSSKLPHSSQDCVIQKPLANLSLSQPGVLTPGPDSDSPNKVLEIAQVYSATAISQPVGPEDNINFSTDDQSFLKLEQVIQNASNSEKPVSEFLPGKSIENKASSLQESFHESTEILGPNMITNTEQLSHVPATSSMSATLSLINTLAKSTSLSLQQALDLVSISLVDAQKQLLNIPATSSLNATLSLINTLAKSTSLSLQQALDLVSISLVDAQKQLLDIPTKSIEFPGTKSEEYGKNGGRGLAAKEVEKLAIVQRNEFDLTNKSISLKSEEKYSLTNHRIESTKPEVESASDVEIIVDLPRADIPEQDSDPEQTHRFVKVERPPSSTWNEWQIDCPAPSDTILPKDTQPYCELCGAEKAYKTINKFIDHLERRHFYCEKCELAYAKREDLIEHLLTAKEVHNYCESCNVDFHTVEGHIRHLKSAHPPTDDPIDCPGCRAHCESAVEVISHLQAGLCRNISKPQFNRGRVLTALIQRHSLGPLQVCSVDEKQDIKHQSLILLQGDKSIVEGLPLVKESAWSPFFTAPDHQVETYAGLQYKCPYKDCGQLFGEETDFVNHLRSGHFDHGICPGCSKQFVLPSALLQHMIVGKRNCHLERGRVFEYAVAAISGGYIRVDGLNAQGDWRFVAGNAPRAELYMDLPQVTGLR